MTKINTVFIHEEMLHTTHGQAGIYGMGSLCIGERIVGTEHDEMKQSYWKCHRQLQMDQIFGPGCTNRYRIPPDTTLVSARILSCLEREEGVENRAKIPVA